jgi:hypothetical protein
MHIRSLDRVLAGPATLAATGVAAMVGRILTARGLARHRQIARSLDACGNGLGPAQRSE